MSNDFWCEQCDNAIPEGEDDKAQCGATVHGCCLDVHTFSCDACTKVLDDEAEADE